jgi:hypothetical protein
MKKATNLLVAFLVIVLVLLAAPGFAWMVDRNDVEHTGRHVFTESGTVDLRGTIQVKGTAMTATAATLNGLDARVTAVEGGAGSDGNILLGNGKTLKAIHSGTTNTLVTSGQLAAGELSGNVAQARIAEALKAPGAIGGTTPAAGTFSGVTVGKASVASGVVTLSGTTSGTATLTVADDGSTVTVNKPVLAAVNGTVGATTPAAGAFTTVAASGASTLSGAVTVIGGGVTQRWDNAAGLIDTAAIEARTEWTVDGKYSVVGGDASTGLMILKGAVTSGTNATETVTFGTVFGAAPIVTCTYTEDPGDVRPIFVTSVTASNFVANITADMNFGYIAVGTRP